MALTDTVLYLNLSHFEQFKLCKVQKLILPILNVGARLEAALKFCPEPEPLIKIRLRNNATLCQLIFGSVFDQSFTGRVC
jgi:hypothetical protein